MKSKAIVAYLCLSGKTFNLITVNFPSEEKAREYIAALQNPENSKGVSDIKLITFNNEFGEGELSSISF